MKFDFEKLNVYALALRFLALAHEIISDLPRGHGVLRDELDRASVSIVLNIAEGAGEYRPLEKARFYRMSRRSAFECAAIVDVGRVKGVVAPETRQLARDLLVQIASALSGLANSMERRAVEGKGKGKGKGCLIPPSSA